MNRGEIYYVAKDTEYPAIGREQYAGRPGVIVSNDKNNTFCDTVQVIYLTTRPKKDMPTHVTVRSTGLTSTACCEQIHTVSTDRIGSKIGSCTEQELRNIDTALCIQLALEVKTAGAKKVEPHAMEQANVGKKIIEIETERDTYKKLYEDLLAKMIRKARKYDSGNSI